MTKKAPLLGLLCPVSRWKNLSYRQVNWIGKSWGINKVKVNKVKVKLKESKKKKKSKSK